MRKKTKDKTQNEIKSNACRMLNEMAGVAFECCLEHDKQLSKDFDSAGIPVKRTFLWAFMIGFMECNRVGTDGVDAEGDQPVLKWTKWPPDEKHKGKKFLVRRPEDKKCLLVAITYGVDAVNLDDHECLGPLPE